MNVQRSLTSGQQFMMDLLVTTMMRDGCLLTSLDTLLKHEALAVEEKVK